jgi:hypothetical protein
VKLTKEEQAFLDGLAAGVRWSGGRAHLARTISETTWAKHGSEVCEDSIEVEEAELFVKARYSRRVT